MGTTLVRAARDRANNQHFSTRWFARTDPLTDLGLTLPVFLGYHLGVVLLDKRNAADFVTTHLVRLADRSLLSYAGLTLGLGTALVAVLLMLGRGARMSWKRVALVVLEGIAYAIAMRTAAHYAVGALRLGAETAPERLFDGIVMSLGAGFYEELTFRVLLFGVGGYLLAKVVPGPKFVVVLLWALTTAAAFSAWHYVHGEAFELRSFVFRWVCGLFFVVVYRFRGFAPAVWTHALYDVWVLVL